MTRSDRRRIAIAGLLVLAMVIAGTVGLAVVEGISFFDAFYQTVVTIATAGIAGSQASTTAGKLLTIALLLLGGGVMVYVVGTIVRLTLEGELAHYFGGHRMRSRIESLRDHFIICGFGRVGYEVAEEFQARSLPFIIVDNAPAALELAQRRGYLTIHGDATLDETLEAAGVGRARCLIAASGGDAQNTYITLSAKALNANIFVVARASQLENERKLRQAGADRVVSPYSIAGRHLALAAVQPLIFDFVAEPNGDRRQLILAELLIEPGSRFAGHTIADVLSACTAVTVLGLRHASGEITVGPSPAQLLQPKDELIVLGPQAEIERLGAGLETNALRVGLGPQPAGPAC